VTHRPRWYINRGMRNETSMKNEEGMKFEMYGPYGLYGRVTWNNNIGCHAVGI
jgi:hypothetical protein